MKHKVFKYLFFVVLGILLVLVVTNPSPKQFRDYIGDYSGRYYDITFKRTENFLIFSTYEFSYITNDRYWNEENTEKTNALNNLSGTYTGLFSNFYKK